jgi:hypothetical protein
VLQVRRAPGSVAAPLIDPVMLTRLQRPGIVSFRGSVSNTTEPSVVFSHKQRMNFPFARASILRFTVAFGSAYSDVQFRREGGSILIRFDLDGATVKRKTTER